MRAFFAKVTKGSLSGNAGEPAKEDFKINGQYVDTPEKGVVGIPFFDNYVTKAALEFLDDAAKSSDKPFFINVNFMKVHQPNMPNPDFIHKSMSKSKYADSVCELDAHIGAIMDKLRSLGLDKNTLVFYTTDNGAWQDVYPDAGYTPFRGTKGTIREGGNRVPAIAIWPGKIAAGSISHDIVGGLDLMATFASVAGVKLPTNDRESARALHGSISPRTNYRRARRGSETTRRVSICVETMDSRLAVSPWTRIWAGKARRSTSQLFRRSSTSGRIRRSVTTYS